MHCNAGSRKMFEEAYMLECVGKREREREREVALIHIYLYSLRIDLMHSITISFCFSLVLKLMKKQKFLLLFCCWCCYYCYSMYCYYCWCQFFLFHFCFFEIKKKNISHTFSCLFVLKSVLSVCHSYDSIPIFFFYTRCNLKLTVIFKFRKLHMCDFRVFFFFAQLFWILGLFLTDKMVIHLIMPSTTVFRRLGPNLRTLIKGKHFATIKEMIKNRNRRCQRYKKYHFSTYLRGITLKITIQLLIIYKL